MLKFYFNSFILLLGILIHLLITCILWFIFLHTISLCRKTVSNQGQLINRIIYIRYVIIYARYVLVIDIFRICKSKMLLLQFLDIFETIICYYCMCNRFEYNYCVVFKFNRMSKKILSQSKICVFSIASGTFFRPKTIKNDDCYSRLSKRFRGIYFNFTVFTQLVRILRIVHYGYRIWLKDSSKIIKYFKIEISFNLSTASL